MSRCQRCMRRAREAPGGCKVHGAMPGGLVCRVGPSLDPELRVPRSRWLKIHFGPPKEGTQREERHYPPNQG